MLIKLLAIGTKMPEWVRLGYQEYAERMPKECRLKLIEINAIKRTKNSDLNKIMQQESELLWEATEPSDLIVALDREGQSFNTEQLAQKLEQWRQSGQNISLWIGGPEGIAKPVLQKAQSTWSLSSLTLPHPLVRIVVAEQLYRAMSILQNHPYHR